MKDLLGDAEFADIPWHNEGWGGTKFGQALCFSFGLSALSGVSFVLLFVPPFPVYGVRW